MNAGLGGSDGLPPSKIRQPPRAPPLPYPTPFPPLRNAERGDEVRHAASAAGPSRGLSRDSSAQLNRVTEFRAPCVGSELAVRAEAMDVRPRRVARETRGCAL